MKLDKKGIKSCLTDDWVYFTNEYIEHGYAKEIDHQQSISLLYQKNTPFLFSLGKRTRSASGSYFSLAFESPIMKEKELFEANKMGHTLLDMFIEKDPEKLRDTLKSDVSVHYFSHAMDANVYEQELTKEQVFSMQDEWEDFIEDSLKKYDHNSSGTSHFHLIGKKGGYIYQMLKEELGVLDAECVGEKVWKVNLKPDLFTKKEKSLYLNDSLKDWLLKKGIPAF